MKKNFFTNHFEEVIGDLLLPQVEREVKTNSSLFKGIMLNKLLLLGIFLAFGGQSVFAQTPSAAAPMPICSQANVISLFSNAFTNAPVDTWLTPWSAAPVTVTDVSIAGNATKFYQDVTFLGIETTTNQIDATGMTSFRIDFWTGNATQFRIKLVDFGANGAFGGGDDREHELTFNSPAQNTWVSYDIPLSSFTGLTTRAHMAQYILSAQPGGTADFYIDNMYFANSSCISAAPAPTCAAANVISLFSNSYTNVPVDTWLTPWSAAPVALTDVQISGNSTKYYQDVTFLGIETVANQIDATAMTTFHIDFWSGNATQFRIKLVDFGANGVFGGGDDKEHELTFANPAQNQWVSYEIPLSSFTGLTTRAHMAQYILSAMPNGAADFYIDNMYFSTCPATVDVTLCVDLACIPGTTTAPAVGGSFNGQCAGCNFLSDPDGDGIWCATVSMPVGVNDYRFFFQEEGFENFTAPGPCTGTFSGQIRRSINVVAGEPQTVTYGWESCDAGCGNVPTLTPITLCVNMGCLGGVQAPSVMGQFNGWNAGANPVTDPDGDGIYCATVFMGAGAQEYKFFDQIQGEEGLTPGSSCTVTNFGFTNRLINVALGVPQSISFGWESCTANCVPPPAKPDLKMTFENPATVTNYNLVDFGGNQSAIVVDPTNASNKVVRIIKTTGAQVWAGTTFGNAGLINPIAFTATQQTMAAQVWAPAAGIPVLLKLENTSGGPTAEVLATTTTAGWQSLTWNMGTSTNQPFNLANTYNRVVMFFNFGAAGSNQTFYVDDITFCNMVVNPPVAAAAQSFCILPVRTVANLAATGINIQWYAAATGGVALPTTTPLVNGTTYYATQTDTCGCPSTLRTPVTVTLNASCFTGGPNSADGSGSMNGGIGTSAIAPGSLPIGFIPIDPCTCNNNSNPVTQNNGTFNEFIFVTGPSGAIITGTATNGTPSTLTFTEVVTGPGTSTYTSNIFTHVDGVGYLANLFAQIGAGAPFAIGSIGNTCAYPNVVIDPKGPFNNCLGQPNTPLTATVAPAMAGVFTWSGSGVSGSNFNPSGLPAGNVADSVSFDGTFVNNVWDGITPANPGCIQAAGPSNIVITECCAVNLGVTITKTAGPVHYDQCANPDEVISEVTILMTNTSGQVLNNVYLDEIINTLPAGAFLGVATYPDGVNSNAAVSPAYNYNWNGTTNTSLFANNSGVLGIGEYVEVTLPLKFNAALLGNISCIPNATSGGGTWMNLGSLCLASANNNTCVGGSFPTLVTSPAPLNVNACTSYNNEIQHWLDIYGGATFNHQGRTVEIICNDYCAPHAWQYLDNCSKDAILPVTFTVKYTDGSTFEFCSVINREDPQVVSFLTLPQNLAVDCSSPNAAAQIQAWLTNNGGAVAQLCEGYIFHSNNYSGGIPTSCGAGQSVTFTITNECGLFTSAAAMITVTDSGAPTFTSVPANVTVACGAALPSFGTATATDACSNVTVTFSDGPSSGTACTGISSTRTFTATDGCGNTATAAQTITKAADTSAPTFTSVPANATVACDEAASFGTATATDACSSVTVTFSDASTGSACTGITTTRTFTATDGCGNTATAAQSVTKAADTSAPTFTFVPANTTMDCGGTPAFGTATATDACSSVTVTFTDNAGGGSSCAGGDMVRTFTATDGCGNTATAQQTITPSGDNMPPVFDPVEDVIEIVCGDDVVFSTPSATDNCGSVTITHTDEVTGDVCAGIMNIRKWTATDACGNTATAKQTVWQIGDTTDPEYVNMIEDEAVYFCGETPDYDGVSAVDGCGGNVTVTYEIDYDYEDTCHDGYGYYSKVRYKATDACGNENNETITSHFVPQGNRMAFMYKPANKTVSCSEAYTFDAVHPKVVSYDGAISTVTFEDVVNLTPCGSGTVTRRWTATDVVGNQAIAEQTVNILPDTELPTMVLSSNSVVVNCANEIVAEQPLVSDNCASANEITVTYSDIFVENTVERTWSAQDACGNVANATQIYIILDTQAPVFTTALHNKTISCDASVVFDLATATDACSAVTMSFNDSQAAINCGVVHTRTWSATDALGHVATAVQKITVLDNTAPVFTYVPANQVVAESNQVNFGTPQVTDNCQNALLSYTDEQTAPSCGNTGYTVTRTWVANDGCNNQAIATQQISVAVDAQAPAFDIQLTDKTIDCGGLMEFDAPSATDNSGTVELTFTDIQSTPSCGNSGYSMTRIYSATDACNNVAQMPQTIFVNEDTEAPVFVGSVFDLDMTYEAFNTWVPQSPAAADNCQAVEVLVGPAIKIDECNFTVDYTATDACGNFAIRTQNIHISDCLVLGTGEGVLSTVSIYPNPVETELTIMLSAEVNLNDVTAQVFDMLGKQVLMTQLVQHQSTLNVKMLASGSYTLRLAAGGAAKTVKFVKI